MTVPPSSGPSDPFSQPGGQPPPGQPYPPPGQPYPPPGQSYPPQQYGQQPSYGQPQGYPPPAGAPGYPQQGYGQMPPAPGGFGAPVGSARPSPVTTAAILGFVIGGLALLGAIVVFSVLGSLISYSGILTVLAIVAVVLAAGLIYGGVQALSGKDARILLIAAAVEALLQLISIILNFNAINLLVAAGCVVIVVMLINPQSKAWFDAKGGTHF